MFMQTFRDVDFFIEQGKGSRNKIEKVIGKENYGVVCSASDTHIIPTVIGHVLVSIASSLLFIFLSQKKA